MVMRRPSIWLSFAVGRAPIDCASGVASITHVDQQNQTARAYARSDAIRHLLDVENETSAKVLAISQKLLHCSSIPTEWDRVVLTVVMEQQGTVLASSIFRDGCALVSMRDSNFTEGCASSCAPPAWSQRGTANPPLQGRSSSSRTWKKLRGRRSFSCRAPSQGSRCAPRSRMTSALRMLPAQRWR